MSTIVITAEVVIRPFSRREMLGASAEAALTD
jgi:hypothetical protein